MLTSDKALTFLAPVVIFPAVVTIFGAGYFDWRLADNR
jgi:hypothetical protein